MSISINISCNARGPSLDPQHANRRGHQQLWGDTTDMNRGYCQQSRICVSQVNRRKEQKFSTNYSLVITTLNVGTLGGRAVSLLKCLHPEKLTYVVPRKHNGKEIVLDLSLVKALSSNVSG